MLINPYIFSGQAWTPARITTALWLDAADASTVTTVSGAVSQWNDKSGNSRNVSQSTASARPLYSSNQVNGLAALQFDGNNDYLANLSVGLPVGANARTLIAVYKPLSTQTATANNICAQGATDASGAWFALQFRGTTGAVGDPYFAGFGNDLTDSAAITTSVKIASINFTGNAGTLNKNGTSIASRSLSLNTTGNRFSVGVSPSGLASELMNGLVCEILFFASSISLATEQLTEGYLAHKWGLTANLPSNHPYKNNPPGI